MDSIIFTRIKELCAENEITVNKLETELGMSQYSIGRRNRYPHPNRHCYARSRLCFLAAGKRTNDRS